MLLIKVVLLKYQTPGEFLDGLLGQGHGWRSTNFVPFRSIALYLGSDMELWRKAGNILGNMAVFVPLGVLLPALLRSRRRLLVTLALGLALSVILEALQWLGSVGAADIDDVILNLCGTGLGIGVYILLRRWFAGRARSVLVAAVAVVLAVGVIGTVVALQSFSLDLGVRADSSSERIEEEEPTSFPMTEGVPESRPDLVGEVTATAAEGLKLMERTIMLWEEDQVVVGADAEEEAAELSVKFLPETKVFRLAQEGGSASYEPATPAQIPEGAFVELWGEPSVDGFIARTVLYSEPA